MTIASAIAEKRRASAMARSAEDARAERQRQLEDMEALIETVEARNLERLRAVPADLLDDISALARRMPVPAPKAIWSARTGARLHEVLMSWEGALLDTLRPERLAYADRFD